MKIVTSKSWFLNTIIFHQKEPGLLGEFQGCSRRIKDEPGNLMSENKWNTPKGHWSQFKGTPIGQIWDNMSIKINNDN